MISLSILGCNNSETKREYYSNGNLKSQSQYESNLKNGEELIYDSIGRLTSKNFYVNDTLNGQSTTFYSDGKIKGIKTFVKSVLNGEALLFHPTGNIGEKGQYKDGKIAGLFYQYYPNDSGKIFTEGYFVNVGGIEYPYFEKTFDEFGNIKDEYRPLIVHIKTPSPKLMDTVNVDFEFNAKEKYDSAFVVVGDFDDEFKARSSPDTIKLLNGKASYRFIATKTGSQFIKGELIFYKSYIYPDSIVNDRTYGYFEEKLVIK